MLSDNILLTSLWLLPFAGSLAVLAVPKNQERLIKWLALGVCLGTFALTLITFVSYLMPNQSGISPASLTLGDRVLNNAIIKAADGTDNQPIEFKANGHDGRNDLVVRLPWIPAFNIQYYLGVDGISLSLLVLAGFVAVLSCLASFPIEKSVKGYYSLFLLLTASMIGVFLSLDLFLFYVFFEVMLLPMYFLIGIWGGENREYAAIKFLLYTLFGSVFILVAILILYFWPGDRPASVMEVSPVSYQLQETGFKAHTFDIVKLTEAATKTEFYGRSIQTVIFALFLVGFCVKLPSFPFHTWLPDAHVQAPTPISMILAGILLKIGGYGMIRMAWPLAPGGAQELSYFVALLAVFSILYGALAAMAQTDFKKLVAYSSVSHMGYVTLGMAAMSISGDPRIYSYGVNGAMFMMIAHGITSTGMFFLVGVIYERAHTRDLNKFGGLFATMPIYAGISFLIFFGSMGLPGLCGFVAEVFVVLAAFNFNKTIGILAAAAVILTAAYVLWTLQRIFLGKPAGAADDHGHGHSAHGHDDHTHGDSHSGSYPDMTTREIIIAIPLVFFTVALGVLPTPFLLAWMSPSVDEMVKSVLQAKTVITVTSQNTELDKSTNPVLVPRAIETADR
jgi:NADH-quinone oxidoreductase subunit M